MPSPFLLARALVRAGKDRARAVALARRSRDAYRDDGAETYAVEVETWLAESRL